MNMKGLLIYTNRFGVVIPTVVIPVQHVEQINDLQTAHADSEGKLMGSSLSANE